MAPRKKAVPKGAIKKGTFPRLMKFIGKRYGLHLAIVVVCILINSVASVAASIFMQTMIDKCITPGLTVGLAAVWPTIIKIISTLIIVYAAGLIATFSYTRIMAIVTQGTLCNFRDAMFDKMQSLPIKYFDTHAHGDIMSTYTNDTDAIRQLVSQSMPTLIQSAVTLIGVFSVMLSFSFWLTFLVVLIVFVMFKVTSKVGGASSKFMMAQQRSLAAEEGFVEEMITGQKVVKVFCHEEQSKTDFTKYNDKLFEDSEKAHIYGNVLMPILGNIGNIMYVLVALVGGTLVYFDVPNLTLTGFAPITIGMIVSYLGMSRQLSQIIGQSSMQVSMIAMGLAGASRIFALLDEKEEDLLW